MKKLGSFTVLLAASLLLTSCSLFKRGSGCPTDGRNVGAEKVLSGDMNSKEMKKARKAKFRG